MTHQEVRNAILTGACDEHLTDLQNDLRAREESLARLRARTLKAGDTVTVDGLRPAYINGLTAKVVKVNKTRAVVRFENPEAAGRFGGGNVTVPLVNLTAA